jgi:hypothetical protein
MQPGELVVCESSEILWRKAQPFDEEVGYSIPGEIYLFLGFVPPIGSHAEVIHPKLGNVRIIATGLRVMYNK